MPRYILLSFLFMGWAFYELSGGANFSPPERVAVAEVKPAKPQTAIQRAQANRAARAREKARAEAATLVAIPAVAPARIKPTLPAAAPAPKPQPAIVKPPAPEADLRRVVASRVNLRTGPGTDHNILATLDRGQTVEVLDTNDQGWLRLRTQPGDRVGWIAERLVSPKSEG